MKTVCDIKAASELRRCLVSCDWIVILQTLNDKPRLLARTRVNRLGHRVLGKLSFSHAADEPTDPDMVHMNKQLMSALCLCIDVINCTSLY